MSRMSLAPVLRQTLRKTSSVILSLVIGLSGLAAAAPLMSDSAFALSGNSLYVASSGTDAGDCQTQSSPCQTIAYAIGQSNAGDTINLESDISISSAVNINKALTLEGNHFTLSPRFTKTDNSNNASIMVLSSDVTIQNLTIDGSAGTNLHGVNVYEATNVSLDNVSILNNGHAALIVNGSTITATDLNTSGNAWGAVDVDPGSGVTTPSVFTLNSGSLSESNQIWSDGSHVSGSATVTVNAVGYSEYHLSDTGYNIWTNSLKNVASLTSGSATTYYSTILAAVSAASTGDTVNVAPGDYSSEGAISLSQPISLMGVNATISDISISASDVTVDGFTFSKAGIQANINSAAMLSGIQITNNTFSGYAGTGLTAYDAGNVLIKNNTFSNPSASAEAMQLRASAVANGCGGAEISYNTFTNATSNGAADVNLSCTGSNSSNITVDHNTSAGNSNGSSFVAFSGVGDGIKVTNNVATASGSTVFFWGSVSGSALISNNTFASSGGSAISIHSGLATDMNNGDTVNSGAFTITNNDLSGASYHSISVSAGALTGSLTAHDNNLSGDSATAVSNSSAQTIDATLNYWGSATPDFGSLISGNNVTTTPYFTNAAMTTRSDAKVLPDSNGDATANSATPQVVVTSPSQPVTVTVSTGTTNASVDYSALVSGNTGTLPQTTITSSAATVSIPASTTVTASGGTWDGTITVPTTTTVNLDGDTVATAIEVGSATLHLTFSNAVRLVLPGQSGKLVGFIPAGGTFTPISTVCGANDQTTVDAQLTALGVNECKYDDGTNMVVWTKHFTTFVAYSQSAPQTSSSTGSNSSASTVSSSNSSNTTQSGTGSSEVLGASSTPAATPSTSSATTTQPSSAEAFQPPSGGNNKFLGIAWYIWLIGIAGVALASYIAYAYLSVDRK